MLKNLLFFSRAARRLKSKNTANYCFFAYVCVKLDPDASKIWMSEASHCFGTCPGIVVKAFGSIYNHGK